MNKFRLKIPQVMSWLVLLLAFFLPISTSLVTVIAIVLVGCWLLEGRFSEKWNEILHHPLCLAVLLYVGLMVLGLGWSDDLPSGLEVIKKHWKIMMIPIFLTAVRWDWRNRTIASFVFGVAVVMVLNLLNRFELLHYFGIDTLEKITLLVNHIIFTPMLSLSAYFVVHTILWGENVGRWRWWLVGLASALSCTVFVTLGRAGQLAYFVLLSLLLFQYFQRNRWRAVLLTLVASGIIFVTAYHFSPHFQTRFDKIGQEIATIKSNPETSVGLRLIWWRNSWEIVKQSPWFGVGTGDFDSAYKAVHQLRTPKVSPTNNPHNNYLYVAIRLGILGLLSFLGMFAVQLYLANRIDDGWQRARIAFPLFFLTIMLTDSYLVSHGSGFLFSLFCAVLYKKPFVKQEPV